MPFIATFIVLTISGVLDAGYLVYQHRRKKPLVCPLNHDCSVVTESKWSYIFYFRNETLGLLFYLSLLSGILGIIFFPAYASILYLLILLATTLGLLFSIFLILI